MDINEDQNTVETDNTTPTAGMGEAMDKGRPFGPAVGIIIVVALLILGGLYFWGSQAFDSSSQSAEEIKDGADDVTANLEAQGTSDNVGDIENDLGTTDLENLDADLQNIDAELSI